METGKQEEPKESEISKAEYELLASFRYALRQFLRFSEQAAEDAGLTPQQHQALLAIRGFPGRDYVTVGELAERLQIRHHSTVGLIDRLESQELVTRRTAEADRRQVYVALTSAGRSVLEGLTAFHRSELQRIGEPIRSLLEYLAEKGKPDARD